MPCYFPLEAWRSHSPGRSGKFGIVFTPVPGQKSLRVPCGQCIGCRLERSRQWAIRCMYESSLYEDNCFLTLTYSDEFLPKDGSLQKSDFQKFMKRLRKRFSDRVIRFFHCGEYGDRFGRPHYHALIFGFDFSDKYLWRRNARGDECFRSAVLEQLWPYGQSELGLVTFESAAYVARYVVKKVNGELADEHYHRVDPDTGEYFKIAPEYCTMSRRGGIGKGWFDKFKSDVYPSDSVVVRGFEMKPPKYFDKLYELESPLGLYQLKEGRRAEARKRERDNTPERLLVREHVARAKLNRFKREVE